MEKDQYPINDHNLYKECLRNHAASLGSYATDGCGEFTLDDTSTSPPNSTLQCAACGCHRNFHRKVSYCNSSSNRSRRGGTTGDIDPENTVELIDYGDGGRMRPVVVDSTKVVGADDHQYHRISGGGGGGGGKKRFRTKFTAEQKEKMLGFAEKLGWKLQRRLDEEDEVEKFCRGIGVSRQVFKVWMHNHKHFSSTSSPSTTTCNASTLTTLDT